MSATEKIQELVAKVEDFAQRERRFPTDDEIQIIEGYLQDDINITRKLIDDAQAEVIRLNDKIEKYEKHLQTAFSIMSKLRN